MFTRPLTNANRSGLQIGLRTRSGEFFPRWKFKSNKEAFKFREYAGTYAQEKPEHLHRNATDFYTRKYLELKGGLF